MNNLTSFFVFGQYIFSWFSKECHVRERENGFGPELGGTGDILIIRRFIRKLVKKNIFH